MANIRDEISKLLDIRIPPNGYRRYIKEVGRTGGFQDTQRDDCIIILCQAVEELQQEVVELRQRSKDAVYSPFAVPGMPQSETNPAAFISPPPEAEPAKFDCVTCGISFKQRIGLEGHKRGKGHKDAVIKSA